MAGSDLAADNVGEAVVTVAVQAQAQEVQARPIAAAAVEGCLLWFAA